MCCNTRTEKGSSVTDYSELLGRYSGKRSKASANKVIHKNRQHLVNSKRLRKQSTKDIYSIDNVIITDIMTPTRKNKEKMDIDIHCQNIILPEFKLLNESYYSHPGNDDENLLEIEDETELQYENIHKLYEMSEMCGHFLNIGQGLPNELKDGLKVTLKLSEESGEIVI